MAAVRTPTIGSEGTVVEVLPKKQFLVELKSGKRLRVMIARESRVFLPRLIVGDRVLVKAYPYDPSRGVALRKL